MRCPPQRSRPRASSRRSGRSVRSTASTWWPGRARSSASSDPMGPARPPRSGSSRRSFARTPGGAWVGGFDVVREPAKVRGLIGLTGQYAAVDELLSGQDNLFMLGRLLGLSPPSARARAAELLEAFDLSDAATKYVKAYSGGMRRRLDLPARLVGRSLFLYLDEPTTGLDPRSRLELWGMIRTLVAEGTTVLLTTQYLDEADRLADEIVVIDHGRVIAAGTPQQLKTRIGGQVLQAQPADPADLAETEKILAAFADGDDGTHNDGQLVSVTI